MSRHRKRRYRRREGAPCRRKVRSTKRIVCTEAELYQWFEELTERVRKNVQHLPPPVTFGTHTIQNAWEFQCLLDDDDAYDELQALADVHLSDDNFETNVQYGYIQDFWYDLYTRICQEEVHTMLYGEPAERLLHDTYQCREFYDALCIWEKQHPQFVYPPDYIEVKHDW